MRQNDRGGWEFSPLPGSTWTESAIKIRIIFSYLLNIRVIDYLNLVLHYKNLKLISLAYFSGNDTHLANYKSSFVPNRNDLVRMHFQS